MITLHSNQTQAKERHNTNKKEQRLGGRGMINTNKRALETF